jgi:hypothetical protein
MDYLAGISIRNCVPSIYEEEQEHGDFSADVGEAGGEVQRR